MYAVIKAGGHQYRVSQGDELTVDFLEGKSEGDQVTFDDVLLVGGEKTVVGAPLVSGAKVQATVKKQTRNPKILVFKFKRRKDYKRTKGHKQPVTVLEINNISM
ncbi:MAG: 50S ribosomal protein L21 [Pseudobacteriovorax sp.]|nr:50S ribosomal protein L21 [Pseudobacteriovorax sp.]